MGACLPVPRVALARRVDRVRCVVGTPISPEEPDVQRRSRAELQGLRRGEGSRLTMGMVFYMRLRLWPFGSTLQVCFRMSFSLIGDSVQVLQFSWYSHKFYA